MYFFYIRDIRIQFLFHAGSKQALESMSFLVEDCGDWNLWFLKPSEKAILLLTAVHRLTTSNAEHFQSHMPLLGMTWEANYNIGI